MRVKKIGIVSLSSGVLGEDFVAHEVKIGIERLKEYGIEVEFLPNSKKGIEFIKNSPEARAKDLIKAFKDDSIVFIPSFCNVRSNSRYLVPLKGVWAIWVPWSVCPAIDICWWPVRRISKEKSSHNL